jgi:hypothetical protein
MEGGCWVLNFKHKGVDMTLQEQTIKEIKELSPQSLTMIYNHIRLLKQAQTVVYSKKRHTAPYLKARKILSMCKVSLSEDIITDREDRI